MKDSDCYFRKKILERILATPEIESLVYEVVLLICITENIVNSKNPL